ncbi:hypothetical protein J6590_026814 [Homalodisca vitripennis]|nr:hypothetical protein J6590_026814 [Homalodisca vitripennis]
MRALCTPSPVAAPARPGMPWPGARRDIGPRLQRYAPASSQALTNWAARWINLRLVTYHFCADAITLEQQLLEQENRESPDQCCICETLIGVLLGPRNVERPESFVAILIDSQKPDRALKDVEHCSIVFVSWQSSGKGFELTKLTLESLR